MSSNQESEKPPPIDILSIFERPLSEMSDEEISASINAIRNLRKTKPAAMTKVKSPLDLMLTKLTPQNARIILEKLEKTEDVQKE